MRFMNTKKTIRPFATFDEMIKAMIRIRLQQGMTQKELAEKIKTKQANISRLETGRANPSVDFLQKIARALDRQLKITFKMS